MRSLVVGGLQQPPCRVGRKVVQTGVSGMLFVLHRAIEVLQSRVAGAKGHYRFPHRTDPDRHMGGSSLSTPAT